MPRKSNRGGVRQGTPGKAYSNRTDLNQPVQVAPSKEYGQGVQQAAAQRAIPLPNAAAQAPAPGPMSAPSAPVSGPMPGELGPLDAPSQRPGEHVSTGLPVGPGAGPEAISAYSGDDTGIQLRALYAKFPNQDLADMIQVFEASRRG